MDLLDKIFAPKKIIYYNYQIMSEIDIGLKLLMLNAIYGNSFKSAKISWW